MDAAAAPLTYHSRRPTPAAVAPQAAGHCAQQVLGPSHWAAWRAGTCITRILLKVAYKMHFQQHARACHCGDAITAITQAAHAMWLCAKAGMCVLQGIQV
jgi:hypothetical protein